MFKRDFSTHDNYIIGCLKSKRIKNFFDTENCKIFIETGTYKGDGVQWALENNFSKIYSVEIHKGLFEESTNRFLNNPKVKISHADTVDFLNIVIPKIKNTALVYLDAHISGIDSAHNPNHPVPLIEESHIILNNFFNLNELIVVIDDERLWDTGLKKKLTEMYSNKNMFGTYIDDSIVFCCEKFIKTQTFA